MWSPEASGRKAAAVPVQAFGEDAAPKAPWRRAGRIAVAVLVAAAVAGCQVRPLYSTAPTITGTDVAVDLSSIAIKPARSRYSQEVRNHLIFLFGNGTGEPATPRYTLDLTVTKLKETAAVVQIADENEPSAANITLTGDYILTDNQIPSGEKVTNVVLTGTRRITASYDVPRQEFAAVRAERDADNRAARELAELLRLAIAQDLSVRP